MSPRAQRIHDVLQQAFQPLTLHVEDESWKHAGHAGVRDHGGGHFVVHITAESFRNQSKLACHRMVYQALGDAFRQDIHALSIHAQAPEPEVL